MTIFITTVDINLTINVHNRTKRTSFSTTKQPTKNSQGLSLFGCCIQECCNL